MKKLFGRLIKIDFGIALLIVIGWKILLTTLGFILSINADSGAGLLDHTMYWDAGWYTTIITDHYATNLASAAFYPLFPLLVGIVNLLSFNALGIPLAGQLVNTVAVWFAVTALIKLSREILGKENKYWLVAMVLAAPAAFFMHVFYSEAVFMAVSLWAYYFALKRQWLGVGILLAVLSAARLPALLIIALCGLEFLRAYDWNLKKVFNKNLLYFLLVPIGFITYMIYLSIVQHDPLGMFHAYAHTNDWAYQIFNPNILETIAKSGYQVIRAAIGVRPIDSELIVNILLPLASIILLALSSVYLLIKHRKKYLPLAIVGILSLIMFTLNSNIVSVHRYILPSLTIYVAIALLAKHIKKPIIIYAWCIIGIAIQIVLFYLFATHRFAG